jgi:hypothetical protein
MFSSAPPRALAAFASLSLLMVACATTPSGEPATNSGAAHSTEVPASIALIRRADLERDLYYFASDSMRGREGGTPDEMRASIWIADQLRKIGVAPAAPDSSYFQWFNMRRTRMSTTSSAARIGGRSLALWTEIVPNTNGSVNVSANTIFVDNLNDTTVDIRGKVAVARMIAPPNPVRAEGTNSYEYRYTTSALNATANRLQRRGAAAIIVVTDSIGDIGFSGFTAIRPRGTYDVEGVPRNAPNANAGRAGGAGRGAGAGGAAQTPPAPVFLVRSSLLPTLRAGGALAELRTNMEQFETPSVNVVGVIRGTDPVLRNEYVLYSSHQDHDGVRYIVNGDSVWAGADDNGTASVALLAMARAFVKQPTKRSILFVYHGSEERGLIGSRYHAARPVVPLRSIVAVLNGEMMGRNNPDSATLLGVQPPHRNSTELVTMALRANALTGKFSLDSLWDRPTHPEGWYFRSDHLPYARLNVPAVMFTTNLHPDYHTVRDTPNRIDYAKLTRMTQWMYITGWLVGNAAKRPGLDAGFQLER